MKRSPLALLLALPLFLAACSDPEARLPSDTALRLAQTPGLTLVVPNITASSAPVAAEFASADFSRVRPERVATLGAQLHAQAVSQPVAVPPGASFEAENLGPDTAVSLPAVNGVNARFLMQEVAGHQVIAAVRLKYRGGKLGGASSFRLAAALSASASPDSVTEAFKVDELSGVTELVGAWRGQQEIVVPDLSETLEHAAQDTAGTRLKLVFLRADFSAYARTCAQADGDVKPGYCSFANKKSPVIMGPLNVQVNTRVITWNVGNVAYTCGAYNYKLCYIATSRRIADTFTGFESTGKPGIIFMQELWHGNCKYNDPTDTSKLCSSDYSYHAVHSINAILGYSGSRYETVCSTTQDVTSAGIIVNGTECVAVDPAQYHLQGGSQMVQPACNAGYDPNSKYDGRDTGFQIVNAAPAARPGYTFKLINTHLVGTNNSGCRALQLNALNGTPNVRSPYVTLVAGDFNTDPQTETAIGGSTFRNVFTAYGSAPYDASKIGKELDNPGQSTAFYFGYNASLDHVMSNYMGGSCSRGLQYDGTDHVWSDCQLYNIYTN